MSDKKPDYEAWLKKFPCDCGHPPDSHTLAPDKDGHCRGCIECHGDAGALLKLGQAISKQMQANDIKNMTSSTADKTDDDLSWRAIIIPIL